MMHPIVVAAAEGELPEWAVVSPKRAAHIERVRLLLAEWADAAALREADAQRWRAAGCLHDALHDAPHDELRQVVPPEFQDVAGKVLHGPACAVRLRAEGMTDEPLLHAITYHTIGHAAFGTVGLALYAADYLEPGRPEDPTMRTALRSRMPLEMDAVIGAIVKARLIDQITHGRKIRPETIAFWNSLRGETRR